MLAPTWGSAREMMPSATQSVKKSTALAPNGLPTTTTLSPAAAAGQGLAGPPLQRASGQPSEAGAGCQFITRSMSNVRMASCEMSAPVLGSSYPLPLGCRLHPKRAGLPAQIDISTDEEVCSAFCELQLSLLRR